MFIESEIKEVKDDRLYNVMKDSLKKYSELIKKIENKESKKLNKER